MVESLARNRYSSLDWSTVSHSIAILVWNRRQSRSIAAHVAGLVLFPDRVVEATLSPSEDWATRYLVRTSSPT